MRFGYFCKNIKIRVVIKEEQLAIFLTVNFQMFYSFKWEMNDTNENYWLEVATLQKKSFRFYIGLNSVVPKAP